MAHLLGGAGEGEGDVAHPREGGVIRVEHERMGLGHAAILAPDGARGDPDSS